MIIYKYGLTKELVFRMLTCEIVEEKPKSYKLKDENNKYIWINKDELEVFNNKVLYSTSPDKKDEYFLELTKAVNETVESYYKKAEDAKNRLDEILKINKY